MVRIQGPKSIFFDHFFHEFSSILVHGLIHGEKYMP